jgi:hypothetical protein
MSKYIVLKNTIFKAVTDSAPVNAIMSMKHELIDEVIGDCTTMHSHSRNVLTMKGKEWYAQLLDCCPLQTQVFLQNTSIGKMRYYNAQLRDE